jgi:hypothetical protein
MIFSAVGCMDNNTNSLPISPDNSSLATDKDDSNKSSSDNRTETEDSESSENNGNPEENDGSSSNGKENKALDKTDGWTGFY